MKKKIIAVVVISILLIIATIFAASCFHYNVKDRNVLVFRFGKLISIKDDIGVYFINPFTQKTKSIFVGERTYDIPTTSVTTSDKKNMSCNAYVTWQITDMKLYYQSLSSVEAAKGRIDTSVYSAIKKVISSITQDEVISGKDGSLCESIAKYIHLEDSYGITVTKIEIKVLDLPDDNKTAVYNRMISERGAIAAKFTADGKKEADTLRSKTDAEVRQITSDAEAQAATIIAEGEATYYQILANAYSDSPSKTEFYKFWTSLNAMRESLQNGGTFVVDEDSPLYEILSNQQ